MAFFVNGRFVDRFSIAGGDGSGTFVAANPGQAFPDKSLVLAAGTGSSQINKAFINTLAITNGGTTTIDLTACTYAGTLQNFTAVKWLKVSLAATTSADTNPSALIGPQGITNGAILCFGTTTGVQEVRSTYFNVNPVNGWAVTASNKVLQLGNPGSHPLTVSVMILGKG